MHPKEFSAESSTQHHLIPNHLWYHISTADRQTTGLHELGNVGFCCSQILYCASYIAKRDIVEVFIWRYQALLLYVYKTWLYFAFAEQCVENLAFLVVAASTLLYRIQCSDRVHLH